MHLFENGDHIIYFDCLSLENLWLSRCFAAAALPDLSPSNSVVLSSQNAVPSLHQLQWFFSSSCVLRLSYFSSSPRLCLGPKYTPSALMKRWVSHALYPLPSLSHCLYKQWRATGFYFIAWRVHVCVPFEERPSVINWASTVLGCALWRLLLRSSVHLCIGWDAVLTVSLIR